MLTEAVISSVIFVGHKKIKQEVVKDEAGEVRQKPNKKNECMLQYSYPVGNTESSKGFS